MSLERWIRLIFTLFVGLNLFQSALTRWCLMEDILRKLGVGSHAETPASARTPARGGSR